MKKKKVLLIVICSVMAVVCACAGVGLYLWNRSNEWPGGAQDMDMYTDFQKPQNLPEGNGKRVKVILLMGQSNSTGIGCIEYLQKYTTPDQFDVYKNGFDTVHINYCVDNHLNCSNGEFVDVDLSCAYSADHFGPEVGMAEKFAKEWRDEEVIILKYTYSATSLLSMAGVWQSRLGL